MRKGIRTLLAILLFALSISWDCPAKSFSPRDFLLFRRVKGMRDVVTVDTNMVATLRAKLREELAGFNQIDWEGVIGEEKLIHFFADPASTQGSSEMKDLLGGKGANLAEMVKLGIPVPQGFTITTKATDYYFRIQALRTLAQELRQQPQTVRSLLTAELSALEKAERLVSRYEEKLRSEIINYLRILEEKTEKKFGGTDNILLVSVRSGAAVSMPGMMDTVLNLGLNDQTVEALAKMSGDRRFAYSCYRLFIQAYSEVVLGAKKETLRQILDSYMKEHGYGNDETKLTERDEVRLVELYKQELERQGLKIPADPLQQLFAAVEAVFKSSVTQRSLDYRRIHGISLERSLSAVNVQAMVFGNLSDKSGTGVFFTRNIDTGEPELSGEFHPRAQGETLVAGRGRGFKIQELRDNEELRRLFPGLYEELERVADILFRHFKDVQDMEFTVENGKLYMLQTRAAKRSPMAGIRIANDLVLRGVMTKVEAIMSIEPGGLAQLLTPQFDPEAKARMEVLTRGIAGSPGPAVGKVVFFSKDAVEAVRQGEAVILVRQETSSDDIMGIHNAVGVLTAQGGAASHAALVAKGAGKACVPGARDIEIDFVKREMLVRGQIVIKEGEYISIDGTTGEVFLGIIPTIPSIILRAQQGESLTSEEEEFYEQYLMFMSWANEIIMGALGVKTNAETHDEIEQAIRHGAEGIGLARTEHTFIEHVDIFQKFILAETEEQRARILSEELLPHQQGYFEDMLALTKGKACVIRLLDPPLHEFLPRLEEGEKIKELAQALGISEGRIRARIQELEEKNPMFGFRGVRLLIAYPELVRLQTRAIFNAAKKIGEVKPEIMIPLVSVASEFTAVSKIIDEVASKEYGLIRGKDYKVGTMIELVAGVLNAQEIAEVADFFSFGTNDLTQGVFKFSRDDAGKWVIPAYLRVDPAILSVDPVMSIEQAVAEFIYYAVEAGKGANPELSVGICGEQGVDPYSIKILMGSDLDYVSGGASRIPVAILAAAQAAILPQRGEIKPLSIKFDDSPVGGLGSVRVIATEESFLGRDYIQATRDLVLDGTSSTLLGMQVGYYREILQKNPGGAVTLRLVNLPIVQIFEGVTDRGVLEKVGKYFELNPGLGNRGPRQAISTHPQIYQTQLEAIFTAAAREIKQGRSTNLRILVPFVINAKEFEAIKKMITEVASSVSAREKVTLDYRVGASIEIPSAVLDAGNIARAADFLVMDTRGLTESAFGMFEEDAKEFLRIYLEKGIFTANPFAVVHPTVQRLINIAVNKARTVNSGIDISIKGLRE